jgi:hypothetical protein
MRVPTEKEYLGFTHRCVILKGPLAELYQTEGIHKSITTALRSAVTSITLYHTNRYWAHHMIIFPVGVNLNNFIFSGDAHHVKRHKVPIGVKTDHPLNPFGIKAQGMTVYWLLARYGGRQDTILNDDVSEDGLATLFDSP